MVGLAADGLKGVSTNVYKPSKICQGLWCANIDPAEVADEYREKALDALRIRGGTVEEIAKAKEGLAGQCTVEIAAFDSFAGLLAHPSDDFDIIVFDMAPTGHTLRLLSLAWEWSSFFGKNAMGASCLGPVESLAAQKDAFMAARDVLADDKKTALFLVARPESSALLEAERTAKELSQLGIRQAQLILNGVFTANEHSDAVATAWAQKQRRALTQVLPKSLPLVAELPLVGYDLVGLDSLRRFFAGDTGDSLATHASNTKKQTGLNELSSLIDSLAAGPPCVVMNMGKGGVGKTTISSCLGVGLAARGCKVDITTTDPANHISWALKDTSAQLDICVDAIDAAKATADYVERSVENKRIQAQSAGNTFNAADEALLREELDSPCTEELAVFDAFAAKIVSCSDRFVVIDTAPTGHTLMLLDQTGAYQADVDKYREKNSNNEAGALATPLELIRAKAKILIVALAEPTPISEALALDADLQRAGVIPAGFIVNSLVPESSNLTLINRRNAQASEVLRLIERAQQSPIPPLGVIGVDWSPLELIGVDALLSLAGGKKEIPAPTNIAPSVATIQILETSKELDAWREPPLQLLLIQIDENEDELDEFAEKLLERGACSVARTISDELIHKLRVRDLPAAFLYRGNSELGFIESATLDTLYDMVEPYVSVAALDGLGSAKKRKKQKNGSSSSKPPSTTTIKAPPKSTKTMLPSQVMRETGAGGCCAPGGGG
uniref:ArsA/GET3 Anion-transporting ATPase-like domain-containing protein n=1 Tax=Aureoumbra lagunensis TaxID=44058 RepID=A0A7S3K2L0_9STRA